ncbi:hypothetical protein Tco_0310557, partial [Tanacetum coccineum]
NIHDDNGVKRSNLGDVHNGKGAKDASNSYAYVVKGAPNLKVNTDPNPTLVLDDSCLNQNDYSLCLMGKVKDFASLSKLKIQQVSHDFIIDGRVTWVEIEGMPLKMWSENTFNRVASKWGVLLDVDDKEDG